MHELEFFGTFLKQKRQEKNMSLRELSEKAGLSHTYLMNIETANKPPPSDMILRSLVVALNLDNETSEIFYDLAAKCKQIKDDKNIYIPMDIANHLSKADRARQVIREVDKLGYSNEFWNEILKQLE